MKKFTLLTLVLVLTLTLCACGRRGDDNTTESITETTAEPTILPMPSTNATLDPVPDTSVPDITDEILGTEDNTGETGHTVMPVG